MKNLYDILQVSENASSEIIEKAYKTLVKQCHPDLQPAEKKAQAEALMKELNEAYEVLSDPEKKARYDRERAEMKKQAEERRRQAEHVRQQQTMSRQTQQSYGQPRPETRQTSAPQQEQEDLMGHMGNIAKSIFSRQRREQRKMENAYREGYQEAYAQYWRSQGFRVKEPWTWKRVKELLKSIAIFAVVILAVWFFPPTHNFLVSTYENNEMLKGLVDFVIQFFERFFQNLFQ